MRAINIRELKLLGRHARLGVLIEAGVIQPPTKTGDPLPGLPDLRLPRGTAARLLYADREGS